MNKFKGKYRIKAHYDLNTNQFCRDESGKLEYNDDYIACAKSMATEIYHYGGKTLKCYVESVARGHNYLKQMYQDFVDSDLSIFEDENGFDYEKMYEALVGKGYIEDVLETDAEIEFKFHVKHIEYVCKMCKALTSGVNISPYSVKNLPKEDKIKYKSYKPTDKEQYDKMGEIIKEWIYAQNVGIGKGYKLFYSKFGKYVDLDIETLISEERLKGMHIIDKHGYTKKAIEWLKNNM